MKEQLQLLYQLQQIDTQIQADQNELARIDDGGAAQQRLGEEEQLSEQMQEDFATTQARLHDKELQLQGIEDEREAKWSRAYGGRVSDPKELQALDQKIAELDRRRDRLEEEILRLMDEVEDKQQAVDQKAGEVKYLREERQQIVDYYHNRTEQLNAELESLHQRRPQLCEQIPTSLLDRYDQIREKSNNLAVVVVGDGTCGGCHTSVPNNYVSMLHNPSELIRCENCRRILVIPD